MMPSWFVEKHLLNALAGIAEIVCAFALLVPKLRNWGVYGIIILLISFFQFISIIFLSLLRLK
jgi:uncharacterized membrane protein